MAPIRVLLADDHRLVRTGIRSLLEQMAGVEVLGEAEHGREVLQLLKQVQPDVVVMDISMAELNGLETTAYITKNYPQVRVLILSVHSAESYVLQAVQAGAAGYLLKTAAREELEAALRIVARGDTYLSPTVATHVATTLRRLRQPGFGGTSASTLEEVTLRTSERELLQLLVEGYTAKEIAARLHLSQKAVESRRARLMDRLDIHDLPGLVRYAMRIGVIVPEPER
jgi:DNA-binding NarL/FixJ family response regulator